ALSPALYTLSLHDALPISNDTKPEYSFFSWVSMLFAAGMGIGLMYFSVSEPISHYSDSVYMMNSSVQRAKDAQLYTFFHWGIHRSEEHTSELQSRENLVCR